MLVLPEFDVIEVRIGNFRTGFDAIIPAAMFAIADATVMQTVKAECVNIRKLRENLRQHIDEKIPIGTKQTKHAAVWKLHHVGLRNLGRIGRDTSPIGVQLIGFCLQTRRIDSQDSNAQTFVLRDILLQSIGRNIRAASLQKLTVVVSVKRVNEPHFTQPHAMLNRQFSLNRVHHGQRITTAEGILQPIRNRHLMKRLPIKWLSSNFSIPDLLRSLSTGR